MSSLLSHGEDDTVDKQLIKEEIRDTKRKISKYEAKDTCDIDKTNLFWKTLPQKSYVKKGNKKNQREKEGTKAKDCLSICISTTIVGS